MTMRACASPVTSGAPSRTRSKPILARLLHRQSAGVLTSRAAFPLMASAIAIACRQQSAAPQVSGFRVSSRADLLTSDARSQDVERSAPKVLEPLGVASFGPSTTDADHVKALRAGLKRADYRGRDTQHVPR